MSAEATRLSDAPIDGDWFRDREGKVTTVVCECGSPVFYRGAIHSRLVVPENGTALCKRCRAMVRVPVVFTAGQDAGARRHHGGMPADPTVTVGATDRSPLLENALPPHKKPPQGYIVELQPDCWLAPWRGDPGRTLVRELRFLARLDEDVDAMLGALEER